MTQTNQRWCWVLVCTALLLAGRPSVLHAEESARGRELRKLLAAPVNFRGFDDPKATFAELLEALARRYNLSFDINDRAFKDADIQEVGKIEIANPVGIPEMHTKLEAVLKKMLSRVSPSATYIIRDDVIEITTREAIQKEFYPDRPAGLLPPLVSGSFDKQPLEAALKELARSSNSNVVLDGRCAEAAKVLITADLVNVPLDTAVQLLADMAGLKIVQQDNVLYVTSKENAEVLKKEQEALRLKHRHDRNKNTDKAGGKADKPPAKLTPPKSDASGEADRETPRPRAAHFSIALFLQEETHACPEFTPAGCSRPPD